MASPHAIAAQNSVRHLGASALLLADGPQRVEDYRVKNGTKGKTRHKAMRLVPAEFMRRFLLHVLPSGFHRIRHYGLLANGGGKASLALARELLCQPPVAVAGGEDLDIKQPTFVCRHCGRAMLILQTFTRGQTIRAPPLERAR